MPCWCFSGDCYRVNHPSEPIEVTFTTFYWIWVGVGVALPFFIGWCLLLPDSFLFGSVRKRKFSEPFCFSLFLAELFLAVPFLSKIHIKKTLSEKSIIWNYESWPKIKDTFLCNLFIHGSFYCRATLCAG